MREVTIVAHPFEFFYIDSIPERRGRPNNVNRWRLRGLCRFLAERRGDFEVVPSAGLVSDMVGQLSGRTRVVVGGAGEAGGADYQR